ncbi:aldo/keto reductase [Chryseobacterium sp. ISL-6]|uniref:aldo/keto reductase n=1 Tax=Chryseobacterium sp. ISL-6 TaxID=2819143 RepID=UPI001BE8F97B|nr:aldo/keto reductase [Chryseobacterium sp. ISL-6]MBT2619521.1 aldo/keto reductase [Chryseobacterium sp. ISL-6]
MNYRKLGCSELEVSAITLRAWATGGWMWKSKDRKEAVEAIKASHDVGVTSIDTAPIYGQGASEEIVGEAIKGFSRDKVQILTKFGMRWDLEKGDFAMKSYDHNGNAIEVYKYAGKESIIYECEQSLKRLGTDYIDLYQIHWPDSTTPIDETFEAVLKLIEQGKVRFAGVCNYTASQIQQAERTLPLVSNQIPFNMVNRTVESETVSYCIDHNKSVLAYSPLERGLLTGEIHSGYEFKPGDHRASLPHFQPQFVEKTNVFLDKIKPIAEQHNASLSQLVLRWTIERPGITIALAGARNAEQAVQNANAIHINLSKEELKTIDDLVNTF